MAYILRTPLDTPEAGGHWIALLPVEVLGHETCMDRAALLCDSLLPHPFYLSSAETESRLTTCAIANAADLQYNENAVHSSWACFLITDEGQRM